MISTSGLAKSPGVLVEGIHLPLTIETMNRKVTVQLQSHALRFQFGQKLYIGSIYSSTPVKGEKMMRDHEGPLVMQLHVLADEVEDYNVVKTWFESFIVNNNDIALEIHSKDIQSFKESISRDFKAGDIISIQYEEPYAMNLYINQELQGNWKSHEFFNMMLNVWIGPHPPSREFKRAILNFPMTES